MGIFALLLLFLLALPPGEARAELFKYKDAGGTLHVVEGPDSVPEPFRGQSSRVSHVPASEPGVILSGPCAGKKLCGVIYLAPWCPYCKRNLPMYKDWLALNAADRRQGLVVVVGAGRRGGDNSAFAAKFGTYSLADDDREYNRLLGVTSFPSYYVIDRNGLVLKDDEAYAWIHYFFDPATPESAKAAMREGRGVPKLFLAD